MPYLKTASLYISLSPSYPHHLAPRRKKSHVADAPRRNRVYIARRGGGKDFANCVRGSEKRLDEGWSQPHWFSGFASELIRIAALPICIYIHYIYEGGEREETTEAINNAGRKTEESVLVYSGRFSIFFSPLRPKMLADRRV